MSLKDRNYQKWTISDKERLKKFYNACPACEKAGEFWIKLTEMYQEGRSVSSIQEQCLRMKLQAKRTPKSPMCIECSISLINKDSPRRIGNRCLTCYNKKWWRGEIN